jgi:hypothetical protein
MTTKDYYEFFVAPYLPQSMTYEQYCKNITQSENSVSSWLCLPGGAISGDLGKMRFVV